MKPLRLGVVSYLNAVPHAFGLDDDPHFTVVRGFPSVVARQLHAGEIDLGLIPSIDYARGDYAIVPGVAIGSCGPVRSVILLHRGPVEWVRRVALDTSSRTSVALARVLLHERLGRDPEYVDMAPDPAAMLEAADAAVLIGDPALYWDGDAKRLDLGEEWTRVTRLPFVYAFWAGPVGPVRIEHVAALQGALSRGLAALEGIAATYNGHAGSRSTLNERYLRDNIVYALGEAEQAGLLEFYRRAHALGLIPRVPKLRFHGHP